jgi:Carboxypeptidase regulatory-like domain
VLPGSPRSRIGIDAPHEEVAMSESDRSFTPLAGFVSATILAIAASPLAAQQRTVDGRVIEKDTRAAVAGATVRLGDRPPVQTSSDGRFHFDNVGDGRYLLAVQALGWADDESTIIVRRDTTLVIVLERTPVQLDTLAVQAHSISVRGVIRDGVSGLKLIDVDVSAPPDRQTKTDPIGRFRFKGVPANTPFVFTVRQMGYLTQSIAVVASEDTTVTIDLGVDPIVQRMVENAKQRLAQRAAPRSYKVVPAVTREDLLRNVNRSVLDVLHEVLRIRSGRIACVVIDEQISMLGLKLLETMLPDRVEYIDVLEFGTRRDSLMVRVYTRGYFPAMLAPDPDIVSQDDLIRAARMGRCR